MISKEFLNNRRKRVSRKLSLVDSPNANLNYVISTLITSFYHLGIGEWMLNKNVEQMKYYFSCSAALLKYIKNKNRFYALPGIEVFCLILSESEDIIKEFVSYSFIPGDRDIDSGAIIRGPMTVAVYLLRGDKTLAEEEYSRWIKGSSYKKGFLFYHHLDLFFEGLLNKNEDTIKAGINKILEPLNLKFYIDEYGPWEKEFSTMANFCGKLAWMLGHEIEFENRQIVMDLVRIDPLDKYPTIEDLKREFT